MAAVKGPTRGLEKVIVPASTGMCKGVGPVFQHSPTSDPECRVVFPVPDDPWCPQYVNILICSMSENYRSTAVCCAFLHLQVQTQMLHSREIACLLSLHAWQEFHRRSQWPVLKDSKGSHKRTLLRRVLQNVSTNLQSHQGGTDYVQSFSSSSTPHGISFVALSVWDKWIA